jgi:hypothetical protein
MFRGFPQYLIRTVQSLNHETQIIIEIEGEKDDKKSLLTKE